MPVQNAEIADIFDRLADLLEIERANPFRVRAYRNGARTIRGHARSMADLLDQGKDLSQLPNIGADLSGKIRTIVDTGRLPLLEEVESRTPAALGELMKIEGLGPRRVRALHEQLDIQDLDDLRRAAREGRIRELEGFGPRTEQLLRERLERFAGSERRTRLIDAEQIAGPLIEHLKRGKGVKDIALAGSYRRCKETVGDLDILVTARKGTTVMADFINYDRVQEVISRGRTRSTVRLRSGISVDLRVVAQASYGAALHYFTGSRSHNIAVRRLGQKKGCKINEYGVFRGDRRIAGRTEQAVYASVDLPYIPPELREDRGELDAARAGKLPRLLTVDEIRGDLHCHTSATDGHQTLQQMAHAAAQLGYEYVSINDHSQRLAVVRGLDRQRLLRQIRAIDRLNGKLDGIVVLKSIELDILEDGTLDLPDSVLKELDLTVCSIHYRFDLSRKKQTERILRAMDNPYFNILGHPTGRLIDKRAPYALDLEKLMEGARERGCCLELNAHPERLDLTDTACKLARDIGVRVAVSTDAHSSADLQYMRFGVNQARRGWLEPGDVINTRPLEELRRLLTRR